MKKCIYLDYQATTPLDPRVREAMAPYLEEHFGNPHSENVFGWDAAHPAPPLQVLEARSPRPETARPPAAEALKSANSTIADALDGHRQLH